MARTEILFDKATPAKVRVGDIVQDTIVARGNDGTMYEQRGFASNIVSLAQRNGGVVSEDVLLDRRAKGRGGLARLGLSPEDPTVVAICTVAMTEGDILTRAIRLHKARGGDMLKPMFLEDLGIWRPILPTELQLNYSILGRRVPDMVGGNIKGVTRVGYRKGSARRKH